MKAMMPATVASANRPSMSSVLMRPAGRRRRALLAVLALVGFLAIGLPEGALGVAWPSIRTTFGTPLSGLGVVLAVYTAGYLAASLVSGRVMARIGTGTELAMAGAVGTIGFAATAAAPAWAVLLAGSLLIGIAGGTLDAAINTYAALHHGVRSLALLHAAYGVGATAAPLLLTALLMGGGSWRGGYAGLILFEAALTAGFLSTRRGWDPPADPAGEEDDAAATSATHRGWATVPLLVGMFFVAVGIEATAGQWAFSLFTEERGVGFATAGLWTGGFWASLTAGRLVVGGLGGRLDPEMILDASATGILVGSALLWWSPTAVVGAVGLGLIGLTEAAVFPTLVAVTPARVGAERAATVVGYQVAAAAVGGAAIPALTGIVAEAWTLEVVGPVLLGAAVVLAGLQRASKARLSSPLRTGVPAKQPRPEPAQRGGYQAGGLLGGEVGSSHDQ